MPHLPPRRHRRQVPGLALGLLLPRVQDAALALVVELVEGRVEVALAVGGVAGALVGTAAGAAAAEIAQLLRCEERLQRRHRRAHDGGVYLRHGPDVDQQPASERVLGLGVDLDAVQAHDRDDGREGADGEDGEEGNLLLLRAVDVKQRADGEGDDPYVGEDVEA
jgi:hypothetical protein